MDRIHLHLADSVFVVGIQVELVVNSIDLMDTFLKGADWWLRTGYLSYWVALTASAVIGLIATRRSLHTGLGITMLLWNNALTFYDSEILGG